MSEWNDHFDGCAFPDCALKRDRSIEVFNDFLRYRQAKARSISFRREVGLEDLLLQILRYAAPGVRYTNRACMVIHREVNADGPAFLHGLNAISNDVNEDTAQLILVGNHERSTGNQ